MDFIENLQKELTAAGIIYTIEDYSDSCCVLTASKSTSGKASPNNQESQFLSVIAVPTYAISFTQAENQNLEIIQILKKNNPIVITEDRWMRANEMMKARLLAHLGIFRSIYARDCEIRKISRMEADAFLEKNHSYGGAKCKYCYGIFLKRVRPKDYPSDFSFETLQSGTLIAAAEFSNARRWNKGGKVIRSYEWIRYASLPELRISGGMGKILKQFIKDIQPDDIMSYADLEWSDGEVYRQLGFSEDGYKSPVTFTIDKRLWTRIPVVRHQDTLETEMYTEKSSCLHYFQNMGSLKYRLKLTEYND